MKRVQETTDPSPSSRSNAQAEAGFSFAPEKLTNRGRENRFLYHQLQAIENARYFDLCKQGVPGLLF